MPDVLTHFCAGVLARAASEDRMVPVFVAGAVLPDVLSRLPAASLLAFGRLVHPVPDAALDVWTPLHLPAGIALWSLLLCMLAREAERPAVLGNLLAGAALHVALDLCQRHVGLGYPLLVPFSSRDFEIGVFGSEATVPWLPLLVPLAAAAAIWTRRRRTARPGDSTPAARQDPPSSS